jgi:hypothetical protein
VDEISGRAYKPQANPDTEPGLRQPG